MTPEPKRTPITCENLADIRTEIDTIDREIVRLIGQRASYVKAAAAFKADPSSVAAPERVEQMLVLRRQWAAEESFNPDVVAKLFSDLVQHFISEELKEWEHTSKSQKK